MRRMRNVLKLLVIIVIVLLAAGPANANAEEHDRKLIMVSIPGLSFQELGQLESYPGWRQLLHGNVAAMNVRTPEVGIEDTYLSMSAGAPAIAWSDTQSWMKSEKLGFISAEQLMQSYTGQAPSGNIVIPTWVEMAEFNARQVYSAVPGLLGDKLHQAGVARYVFGNRDRINQNPTRVDVPLRHAALLLANRRGEVGDGLINSEMNLVSDGRPFGLRTNYEALWKELHPIEGPSVALVELGDLDRLYAEQSRMTDERFFAVKEIVLSEMGHFFDALISDMHSTDELWLFSPLTHPVARQSKSLFTPFMQLDQGSEASEWLTSQTTKRAGIVTYADLTASVLQHFGLAIPEEMRGSRIVLAPIEGKSGIDTLLEQVKSDEYVYKLRSKLIYPLVTFQVFTLLISLVYLLWRKKINAGLLLVHELLPKRLSALLSVLLFSVGIAPFVLLFFGAWTEVSQVQMIILFYLLVLLAGGLLSRLPLYIAYFMLGFFTAGGIIVDGIFGASLMMHSVLGYDPMIGARFYGIGNEYMGALIGAVILTFAALHEQLSAKKWRQITFICAVVCSVFVLGYLAAPAFGTNAGGALSAAVAFTALFIFMLRKQGRVRLRTIVFVGGLGVFIALLSLFVLNRQIAPSAAEMSHIGKALDQLFAGRFDLIVDTVYRKLAMNLRLLGASSWSKLLASGLVVILALSLYSRTSHFQRWKNKHPSLSSGLSAILFGAVTAFFVNDSGIVAAAVMILYAAVPTLLIHLYYSSDSHSEKSGSS